MTSKQSQFKSKLKSSLKLIRTYMLLIIITVLVVVLLRVFVFASFTIPSNSMEPTILSGDKILVNKLSFGARLINILDFQPDTNLTRVKGLRNIQHNDVLVFNFPHTKSWDKIEMNLNCYYVKRCIGLPGDTLSIINGFYHVAGCSDTLGVYSEQKRLSLMGHQELASMKGIYKTYPFRADYNWNIKDFGPLYIPGEADCLKIDTMNIKLYKKLIENETKKSISIQDGIVYLDSVSISEYTFNQNYYFLGGDNGLNSQDSRYWGLLPEYCIVGVASHIWVSKRPSTGEYRTDRFFKKIQ